MGDKRLQLNKNNWRKSQNIKFELNEQEIHNVS